MDYGALLAKALPWVGAAATGNVPALIALAAKQVSDTLGVPVKADPQAIGTAVANATPEQLVALKTAEMAFQEHMQALGFQNAEELAKIGLEEVKTYVGDTQDARHAFSADRRVFWLGVAILCVFMADVVGTLTVAYQILTDGIKVADVGVVAAIFGLLGTINGYVAAQAQQVGGYFFGSSKQSAEKTTAMSSAISQLAK